MALTSKRAWFRNERRASKSPSEVARWATEYPQKLHTQNSCRGGEIGRPACRQAGAHIIKMPCYTYAIKSLKQNYIYVGLTNYPRRRFFQHQNGKEKTTSPYRPFRIILLEKFSTRAEAREREKYLKSGFGKEFLKTLG